MLSCSDREVISTSQWVWDIRLRSGKPQLLNTVQICVCVCMCVLYVCTHADSDVL